MKIIHCADLHLDSRMQTHLSKEKARERQAELLVTFQEMVRYAADNQVDAILIAGDLYDKKNISAAARNVIRDAIGGHPQIDFYYLKGNHDADSFLGSLEKIPENLKLFEDHWVSYTADPGEGGHITVTGAELGRETGQSLYHQLSLDREKFNIVMLHGQEAQTGAEGWDCVDLRRLRDKGIDYLALGHIHSYKLERLDGRGIYCYPGCLEGRGFDECGEHGFVLLEIQGESRTFTHRFVPFAGRRFYTLEVDITGCMTTTQIGERIRRVLAEAAPSPKSLVKLVLTGQVDVECEKEPALLCKQFEEDYYFLKLEDESRLWVDYAGFARDESLKGEFVRTVQGAPELTQEEKAAVIRCGIQALSGEEF